MSFFNVEWVFKMTKALKIPQSPVIGGKLEGIPAKDKKDAVVAARRMIMMPDENIHIVSVVEL